MTYLLIYLGVPAFALMLNDEMTATVLMLVYVYVLIPLGIIRWIDFHRTHVGPSPLRRALHRLFRDPHFFDGCLCLLIGLTIVGWVLYNVFIERQEGYTGPTSIHGLWSFGLGVPLLVIAWTIFRSAIRRKEL